MDREAPRRFLVVSFRRFIFSGGPVPRLSKIAALSETKNLLYLATSLLALGGILLAIKRRMHAVFLFSRWSSSIRWSTI